MKKLIPLISSVLLVLLFGGIALAGEPAPDSLERFLNAAFELKKGMPESKARTILKKHGFPVPVPKKSNEVTSISVGNSFSWTSHFRLSESRRFSLHLNCRTARFGPDHDHTQGIVQSVKIVCEDGRVLELPDPKTAHGVKTGEPQHQPAPYSEPREGATQER